MQLIKKFFTSFILTFIFVIFLQINCGVCSDNMPVQAQPAPDVIVKGQPTPIVQKNAHKIQIPSLQQAPSAKPKAVPSRNQGFLPAFTNMLETLIKVILLIAALAGIIFLFKRIKSKLPSLSVNIPKFSKQAKKSKKNKNDAEKFSNEPDNVSDAVAMFIKHKIK